jgi:hypothetical protein
MTKSSPKTVFILGVEQRSGTNYLWQLLRLHPRCHVGSVGEDFLLEHSQFLKEYADRLYRSWIPKWRERMGGGSDPLIASIGDCLIAFIKKPYDLYPGEAASHPEKPSGSDFLSKTLITKSPSVKNLDHFFRLFPDAYLLLLVRDGRSVVESGMKSFGWTFEDAVRRWNRGARKILEFVDHYRGSDKRFLLVRYEDLVSDTEAALRKVFTFLNFEPDHYDFEAAKNLPIFGSSESKASHGNVHWNKVEKTERFAPPEAMGPLGSRAARSVQLASGRSPSDDGVYKRSGRRQPADHAAQAPHAGLEVALPGAGGVLHECPQVDSLTARGTPNR